MKFTKGAERGMELRGYQVVSLSEGRTLGHVQDVFLAPEEGRLSAFSFRENLFGKTFFINFDHVDRIGGDVVFIKSREGVREVTATRLPQGKNLKTLQGMWVTTQDGEHIGNLGDIDFDRSSGAISLLYFSNGRELPITAGSVAFGPDEIIVTTEMKQAVRQSSHPVTGMLAGVLPKAWRGQRYGAGVFSATPPESKSTALRKEA